MVIDIDEELELGKNHLDNAMKRANKEVLGDEKEPDTKSNLSDAGI